MKLSEYIQTERGTAFRVAKAAGVAPSTVTRVAKGLVQPRRPQAEAISRACDGKVSVAEVYGFESDKV